MAIQRLQVLLERRGVDCRVYDTSGVPKEAPGVIPIRRRRSWILRYWFTADEDVIHYQASDWRLRALIGLLPWRSKTVVSIQGNSLVDSLSRGGLLRRLLIRVALNRTCYVILANPDHADLVRSLGVPRERMAVIPAFIPPVVRAGDDEQIPAEVWAFCRAHRPLLLANGAVAFYRGEDLYGLDLLVELIRALKALYPEIGLVVPLRPVGGGAAQAYWAQLMARVAAYDLAEQILWIRDGVPVLHPLMRRSSLFLRPTNTDGDAVSLREALYLGVPAVASDVAPRPAGTVLFRNRDAGDLIVQVKRILSGELVPCSEPGGSSFDRIWEIYQDLTGECGAPPATP